VKKGSQGLRKHLVHLGLDKRPKRIATKTPSTLTRQSIDLPLFDDQRTVQGCGGEGNVGVEKKEERDVKKCQSRDG